MDAVLFCNELYRMCGTYPDCEGCGVPTEYYLRPAACKSWCLEFPEEAVAIVEKWGKEHPRKTNGQKFEELFGKNILKVARSDYNNKIIQITLLESELCKWWDELYEKPKEE